MAEKKEMIEDALSMVEADLIAETMTPPKPARRAYLRRITLPAAALLLLFCIGLFLKDDLLVKRPTGDKTVSESKHSSTPGQFKNGAAALAKYPVFQEVSALKAILEEYNALEKSGQAGTSEKRAELLSAYGQKELELKSALDLFRSASTAPLNTGVLAAYTKKTADRILIAYPDQNIVYSPADLYETLCMLTEVTDGLSRRELEELVGLNDPAKIRSLSNTLWRNLYREDPYGKTALSNSVWLNERVLYAPDTVRLLSDQYYADVFSVPMGDDETDRDLQRWVGWRTDGLLEEKAEGMETTPETALILISALCFKDSWETGFESAHNTDGVFRAASGEELNAVFMHQGTAGGYVKKEGRYTAAQLSFRGGSSMVFLLPDEDVPLKELIEAGELSDALLQFEEAKKPAFNIAWSVPKFDAVSDISITDLLKSLGVHEIFSAEQADFSLLTGSSLHVSQIMHAGRVRIDEEGCEAAAVTSVQSTGAHEAEIHMDLDRPFAFMITGVSGLPLFIGIVNTL